LHTGGSSPRTSAGNAGRGPPQGGDVRGATTRSIGMSVWCHWLSSLLFAFFLACFVVFCFVGFVVVFFVRFFACFVPSW
jgi:hypothetical protein